MFVRRLSLTDFRSYPHVEVEFDPGLTAVLGDNGQGKTNLLEAIGFLTGHGSFRGAPDDALVRSGVDVAIVRAEVTADDGRDVLIECEIAGHGRNRFQVNRNRLNRVRDLVGYLTVTVFSPDDLELVKGSPSGRRRWLDEAVVGRRPMLHGLRSDLDRILRQRNTLLRQARGRLSDEIALTLDVWDAKLAEVGERLRNERTEFLDGLGPRLAASYDAVADAPAGVEAVYSSSWPPDRVLADCLADARTDDLKRAVTTVGPHRDEVLLSIGGLPARTHASQGEQRSLALAMRLAADAMVRAAGTISPVLLLDDVFSELDARRSTALLEALPDRAQSIVTSAAGLPPSARPDRVLVISGSTVTEGQ